MLGQQEKDISSSTSGLPATRKTYWRSVSWSERSPSNPNPKPNSTTKGRSCLPPLQPLSIARRCAEEWPKAGSDDLGIWPNHPPTPGARPGSVNPIGNSDSGRPPVREFQLKKDKLAFFDKECSRIVDHLYLGSEAVAKNRELLRRNGITHVLNCVGFVCPEYFKSDLVYKTLWLQDSPSEDITSILYDVFDYFEDVREQGGRVLIHCCQGISRSTSLVIAYLMWRNGQSFEDAFQYVKAARGVTNPNMGFACQLLQCQKRVHAMPVSPTSVLRMYRMAPHSPYDPLHLVPKLLNCPGALGLDSRGSFIVHVPSAIYVWIGKNCKPVMASHARASASQVVRYERAKGQIMIVREGEETQDFWDALASGPLLVDDYDKEGKIRLGGRYARKDQVDEAMNNEVGNKKVVEYDTDFDIFLKALSGGVVPPFPLSGAGYETCLPARESGWGRLRHKLASGIMKGLVTAAKLTCDDSQPVNSSDKVMDTCKEVEPSKPSIESLLSPPSPPCGSPDSFSCYLNANRNSSSKSPSPSPSPTPSPSLSDHSSLFTFSPASSNWSDSSLSSPSSIGLREPFDAKPASGTEVCFPCKVSSRSKGSSPSLAERRGSIPPSLKLLSSGNDPPRASRSLVRSWSFSFSSSQDEQVKNNDTYEFGSEDFYELSRRETSLDSNLLTACEEVNIEMIDVNNLEKFHLGNDFFNKSIDLNHPVLFQWPSIEKVDMLHAGVLNSKSVFLMISPNVNTEKDNPKTLYIWVGRDVQFEKGQREPIGNVSLTEDRNVYWEQVGSDFLSQMGLPMDTPMQMVQQGMEPEQFLNHFSFH